MLLIVVIVIYHSHLFERISQYANELNLHCCEILNIHKCAHEYIGKQQQLHDVTDAIFLEVSSIYPSAIHKYGARVAIKFTPYLGMFTQRVSRQREASAS